MEDAVFWIWLQLVFQSDSFRLEEILSIYATPKEIYDSSEETLRISNCFTAKERTKIKNTSLELAKDIYNQSIALGCKVLTPASEEYPDCLRNIYAMPLVLYVKGDLSIVKDFPSIAMVGTRDLSIYGKEASQSLASALAKAGVIIVSGLALGIDTICHTAALKAGGKTIAVLGCGIDYNYPISNTELKRIISENGAVITEYPPGTPPIARNFPFRNRIISGISLGVVVVEASEKSGSLITAGHALSQGRDVFAVPNSIFEAGSKGTHKLIKQGAKIVTSPIDILEEYFHLYAEKMNEYGIDLQDSTPRLYETKMEERSKPIPKKTNLENLCSTEQKTTLKQTKKTPPAYLTKLQLEIYNLLEVQPISIEIIYTTLNLTIAETLSTLTELEIYDLVKAMPARRFCLK